MRKFLDHSYIFLTILLTVYSQLIIRWQMSLRSPPDGFEDKLVFYVTNLFRPWIVTAIVATFFAGLSWMVALSKFQLSYAFPFMALNFLLIMLAGYIFFGEAITSAKMWGNILIIFGVFILAMAQE